MYTDLSLAIRRRWRHHFTSKSVLGSADKSKSISVLILYSVCPVQGDRVRIADILDIGRKVSACFSCSHRVYYRLKIGRRLVFCKH